MGFVDQWSKTKLDYIIADEYLCQAGHRWIDTTSIDQSALDEKNESKPFARVSDGWVVRHGVALGVTGEEPSARSFRA